MSNVARFKEPTLQITAPQSEVLAVASAAAYYCIAHEGKKDAAQIITLLEQFHQRIVAQPGLTMEARRFLDDLEERAQNGGETP